MELKLSVDDFTNVDNGWSSRLIYDKVAEAMWPFRGRMIQIYMGYDIDYHRYHVTVGFVLMDGYTISFVEEVGAWDLVDYYDREVWKIANSMFEKFRNREDYLLAPLITLGEN